MLGRPRSTPKSRPPVTYLPTKRLRFIQRLGYGAALILITGIVLEQVFDPVGWGSLWWQVGAAASMLVRGGAADGRLTERRWFHQQYPKLRLWEGDEAP